MNTMRGFETKDIGSETITIATKMDAEQVQSLMNQQGRVFTLARFRWNQETGETEVCFEPGNGVMWITDPCVPTERGETP